MTDNAFPDALIGWTGFVGGALNRARPFGAKYNSSNFRDMTGRSFGLVVCAGVTAEKWRANQEPEVDQARIDALAAVLQTIKPREFILISTIDVHPDPGGGADEDADLGDGPAHAYGRHRLALERRVQKFFPLVRVVRLPALYGDGLQKNALHDLMNGRMLGAVNPASRFQWRGVHRLADDIDVLRQADVRLANLFTEPFETGRVIEARFAQLKGVGAAAAPTAAYNLATKHAGLFGRPGERHIASAEETLADMTAWIDRRRTGAAPFAETASQT